MPPCSIKAAVALDGAVYRGPHPPFAPHINPASAKLRRDVPVHEMLLGKGAASKQKLERTAAQLIEEELRQCERTHPTPRATDELAQRYSERVGQTAHERLIAPRQVSLERAMEDDEHRASVRRPRPWCPPASSSRVPRHTWTLLHAFACPSHDAPRLSPLASPCAAPQTQRPFSPVRSSARLYEAGAFRTVPASDASPSSSSMARLTRSARPSHGSRDGKPPSRGASRPSSGQSSAVAVAERSAVWNQLREQKVLQHKARLLRSEEALCPFKPAVERAAAASSHDVVSRCKHWQEQRERRLRAAIQREMQQVALETSQARPTTHHRGPASSPGVDYAGWAGAEPRFMAPTVAAREREALAIIPSAWEHQLPPEHADVPLPEWAAPRAQHVP